MAQPAHDDAVVLERVPATAPPAKSVVAQRAEPAARTEEGQVNRR